jgi:hypothetical protein
MLLNVHTRSTLSSIGTNIMRSRFWLCLKPAWSLWSPSVFSWISGVEDFYNTRRQSNSFSFIMVGVVFLSLSLFLLSLVIVNAPGTNSTSYIAQAQGASTCAVVPEAGPHATVTLSPRVSSCKTNSQQVLATAAKSAISFSYNPESQLVVASANSDQALCRAQALEI